MVYTVFIIISFAASVIGAICGIGGGIIIKPVLDASELYSVSTVSFISGCVVLAMSGYSVAKARLAKEEYPQKKLTVMLGIGAALGGIVGKFLFDAIKAAAANPNAVGAVQSAALFLITLITSLYTVNEAKVRTHSVESLALCVLIGFALGLMSAFLGIGGGPMNLLVLSFAFTMKAKVAAYNSLCIILISQLSNLIFTLACGTVPDFPAALLAGMVLCGILGGIVGRRINKKIDDKTVKKLFFGMLCVIMAICVYNFYRMY